MRCAAYARYSTDKQNPLSAEDQLRKCREYAESRGWTLLETQCYKDEEISGATLRRPGLDALLSVSESPARPFDAVIFEDTSRLSRKQADALNLCERFSFAGVRVCFVAQGIDSEDPTFQLMLMARGMIDQFSLSDTANRVRRGMVGNLSRGLHTGGRCYGYRIDGPEGGRRMVLEPGEAKVVRRIFEEYAAGDSLKTIAKRLNTGGVAPPMPYRGQPHPSWAPSALWVMLRNEKFHGMVVWNKTRKVRNPQTRRRVHRRLAPSEWKRVPAEHLRIIPEQLWNQVQVRLAASAQLRPGHGIPLRSLRSQYLLSGFLRCGTCASNVVLVAGGGKWAHAKYGCPLHHQRGICSNGLLVDREKLEREVLAGLKREVMREDVVRFAIEEFERQLRARIEAAGSGLAAIRQEREGLKREAANLARAIAEAGPSPTLLADLARVESGLEQLNEEIFGMGGRSVEAYLSEIEEFVRCRIRELPGILCGNVERAKFELAKHTKEIVLTPDGNGFRISGEFDFCGTRSGPPADFVFRGAGGEAPIVPVRRLPVLPMPVRFEWGVAA